VYNVITLKEDGLNDSWVIPILDLYSDNEVQLFNRWGVLVYEQEDYVNNSAKAFKGYSDGRVTLTREEKLPTGTYYYSIKYVDSNNVSQEIGGWLFIFNNTNN
jgi:gliding motility-associated-like protein